MGKSIRDHVTLCPPLDPIISNRTGSVQPFLDVAGLEDLAALISLAIIAHLRELSNGLAGCSELRDDLIERLIQ